jgi:hypothetical protein
MEETAKQLLKFAKNLNPKPLQVFAKQQVLHAKLPSESELEKFLKV